jgi:hypothetical protein
MGYPGRTPPATRGFLHRSSASFSLETKVLRLGAPAAFAADRALVNRASAGSSESMVQSVVGVVREPPLRLFTLAGSRPCRASVAGAFDASF